MKKIINIGLSLAFVLSLIGCGGGSDDSSNGSTADSSSDSVALIESGQTGFSSSTPYNIKGNYGIYYNTVGCRTSIYTLDFAIYENGFVAMNFTVNGNDYPSECYVESAYEHVELTNTTDVNGTYVNYFTFYDNATKIYYEHSSYSYNSSYRLIEIINDGMNAIVDKGDGSTIIVQIEDAYRKIDL